MKGSKRLILAVVVLLGGAVWLGRSFAQNTVISAGPTRVAVCDVVQLFNNYQRAKDAGEKLNEGREAIRVENQKRIEAIENLRAQLGGLLEGSPEHEQKLNDVQLQEIQRQAWLKFEDTRLMREHHTMTKDMYNELREAVSQVAQEHGFTLVLYHMRGELESTETPQLLQQIQQRKVLYVAKDVDLTDIVLKRLNDNYQALQP